MDPFIKSIGPDTHKDTTAVAMADDRDSIVK